MDILIRAKLKPVEAGDFHYGNIPSTYGVNTRYFTKNNEPYTVIAGELHFSRCPRARWKSTLLKMRDCGINTVSTYVFWNYHEEEKGVFNFSGNRDVAAFLSLCRKIRMPCILRIGPWCHGEVVRGGFPKRINRMRGKRTDNPKYLAEVREFWTGLYKEVAPFLDGETVIGMQLENEYTGKTSHLHTLRKIAEEIGFRVPFFTMTAWPSGVPDREFLPTMGGYPDGPWNMGKKALKPNNRFAITPAKSEDEIGADLHKNRIAKEGVYDHVPYASCETGPGNQVTQHRRPYISEKDGYGVGFAKFASGMQWLGYYMFCGGTNPNDRPMQESRRTGYPNNYSLIDYDFQAPISRYGECRPHGDRLRLLHLFIREFDDRIALKQAFFPKWASSDPTDISFLKCSVRADASGSGYFFASAYEKGLAYKDFHDVRVRVDFDEKQVKLPPIEVKAGAMFFYPFHLTLGNTHFDYILTQPIAKLRDNGETVCWFVECEGIPPRCKTDNGEIALPVGRGGTKVGDVRIVVLPMEEAKRFHVINGKAVFTDGTVYCDGDNVICERISETDLKKDITLTPCARKALPYNSYLYSHGRRAYYELHLPENILENRFDVRLEFDFEGLNLQVFSGTTLINDYFNIDGRFVMYLRDYAEYFRENPVLTLRSAPKTRFGVSNVYNEIPIPLHSNALTLRHAWEVTKTQQTL